MRTTTVMVLSAGLLLAGCGESLPNPSFDLLFPAVKGELLNNSSPSLIDLNGDGALDIVYGTGVDRLRPQGGRFRLAEEPKVAGYVTAVSGRTNEILWRAPHSGEAFTTPRFAALNGDDVPDVVMGGRQGSMSAFSGKDGALLWRVDPTRIAVTPVLYNFFTPALIADANGDGVTELVVSYGGDDTRLPGEARDPGFLVVLSGADGTVLAVHKTPDGAETYSSIIAYARADGTTWMIFGTGGERQDGAAWRAPVTSLLDGSFEKSVERLVPTMTKGVMAPATLVELTGDQELDIVISTFDGRLIVLDGASGKTLWERQDAHEESYHPAAVVRIGKDGRLGLFVSRGIGVFPRYAGSVHRLHDALDGRVLYENKGPLYPAGAPLAVDLTGDGIDEPIFFGARGRIHVLHLGTRKLVIHDVPANFISTPHIGDARGNGTLELIGVAWTNTDDNGGIADWRNLHSELLRMDLNADVPAFRAWAAYMGTAMDGRYHTGGAGDR
jgi:outer membrane protein assembly factor BamB